MKKLITGAFVLALAIGSAEAQTVSPKEKGHKKEHKMHQMQSLNLTEDQKAKLKELREQQKNEMQALKENKKANKEQRKEMQKKYHNQMLSILTPEQKLQMEKMKAERKEGRKNGDFKKGQKFSRKGNIKGGAEFGKELGLTDEQKVRMDKIRTDFRSQFETLRNDKNLSREQKREKMKELMKAQQEQTKSILTKEQIEKMESMRKERSSRKTK